MEVHSIQRNLQKTSSCRFFKGFRASVPEFLATDAGTCREKRHPKQHPTTKRQPAADVAKASGDANVRLIAR